MLPAQLTIPSIRLKDATARSNSSLLAASTGHVCTPSSEPSTAGPSSDRPIRMGCPPCFEFLAPRPSRCRPKRQSPPHAHFQDSLKGTSLLLLLLRTALTLKRLALNATGILS